MSDRRRPGPWPLLVTLTASTFLGAAGCSTIEPGGDVQIAPIVYDEDYFYCVVEPKVLLAKKCGPGDPSLGDASGGCHEAATPFRFVEHAPVACDGLRPTSTLPSEARNDYQSAVMEMALSVESAPLLTHPANVTAHPRAVIDLHSPEADLIRTWANQYSSR